MAPAQALQLLLVVDVTVLMPLAQRLFRRIEADKTLSVTDRIPASLRQIGLQGIVQMQQHQVVVAGQ